MDGSNQGYKKIWGDCKRKYSKLKQIGFLKKLVAVSALAILFYVFLNTLWALFEALDYLPFPSPLDYEESLQSIIDVFFAIVIAAATIHIELSWKQHDEKQKRSEHISELIISADSLHNAQIIGHAILDAHFVREYVRVKVKDCENCDLCIAILPRDRNTSLIPQGIPVCSEHITECKFKSKGDGDKQNRKDFSVKKIRFKLYDEGAFLFFDHCEQNEQIVNFISDVLNCNCESNLSSELIITLQCTIDQPDFSNSDRRSLKIRKSRGRSDIDAQKNMAFDCKVVFSIRPTSAFLNPEGCFNCGFASRKIFIKEQSDKKWSRIV